jgi:WD40 repeat protein
MNTLIGSTKSFGNLITPLVLTFPHQVVISCSNDSTIKVWSLNKFLNSQESGSEGDGGSVTRVRSVLTLDSDTDYVRGIDYS